MYICRLNSFPFFPDYKIPFQNIFIILLNKKYKCVQFLPDFLTVVNYFFLHVACKTSSSRNVDNRRGKVLFFVAFSVRYCYSLQVRGKLTFWYFVRDTSYFLFSRILSPRIMRVTQSIPSHRTNFFSKIDDDENTFACTIFSFLLLELIIQKLFCCLEFLLSV